MRKNEIEKLLKRSKEFKEAAEFHYSRESFDLAVFNLEQCLQLFLKAKLLKKGVGFPKTHTLRKLFLLLGESLEKLEEFKLFAAENSLEFASLEDAYVTARYFSRDFEKDEVDRLKKFIEEVMDFVRKAFD
ncbi:MAG: HEPN domain-containing protein [Candidatus Bathyarchaeia archaeon]